ncbi:Ribosomal protein L34Ae [Heracleum sosnowskyi]|uniref:Ribosomal protein L34Ae n=1 Tax=Heracleum sosnowskyi TaxID=360622 RepID=A0AAD8MTQ4_9APIA|nr:Ribosomal protein L34Ae [Heracleum sosnowskyi]
MALLGSCWFIIENILLSNGSLSLFCLSFYIHPFFLFFCRIYLFIRWLHVWLLCVIVFTYRVACFFLSLVFLRLFRSCLVFINSLTKFTSSTATSTDDFLVNEKVEHKVPENDHTQIKLFRHDRSIICAYEHQKIVFEVLDDHKVISVSIIDDHVLEEEPNHEEIPITVTSSSCTSISSDNLSTNVVSISASWVDSDRECPLPVTEQELIISQQEVEEEVDLFYKNYADRMRWFDVLSHDRTCGIKAILNQPHFVGHGSTIDQSIVPMNLSEFEHHDPYNDDHGVRKRLLRSLESDLEMVYVAQTCLSWEELHHQYRKVKALVALSGNGGFVDKTAERFQKFQVLVERFMENERGSKSKRYWTYVQRRSSIKSLLQVPSVSGYVEEKDEIMGEVMEARVVLKAIENSINAFCLFVKTEELDPHKSWWRTRSVKWTYQPLEDPRDFNLLCDITNSIKKKKQWIKELEGMKTWCKLKGSRECEDQKKEMMFMTIDIKLVTRVLKLSMVSTSQLKWCKEKLDSIDFRQRKLVRTSLLNCPLFPSS